MVPRAGLEHERDSVGAAAAEDDGVDRDAGGILPGRVDDRALAGRAAEAAVRVGGDVVGVGVLEPVAAQPVLHPLRRLLGHAFPPHVALGRHGDVGEDGVGAAGLHGHRVGVVAGAGSDSEEAVLGVDGAQAAVLAEAHPGDVVADALDLPSGDGGLEHGEVGLAAGAREGGGDVLLDALGVGDAEDEHVLGHPAFLATHGGGDAQGEALLAEQGVAAVAAAVRHDLAGLREVGDVLGVLVAGPRGVLFAHAVRVQEGSAERVQGRDELAVAADALEGAVTDAGHDFHGLRDVRRVRELDAVAGQVGAERSHGEGDDVHRAALHAAVVEAPHGVAHLVGVLPVVGGAGVLLVLAADERVALDAGDVARVGAREVRVGAQLLV